MIIADLDKANYSSGVDGTNTDFNATGNDFAAGLQPKIEPSADKIQSAAKNEKKRQRESTFINKKSAIKGPTTEIFNGGETIMRADESSPREQETLKMSETHYKSNYQTKYERTPRLRVSPPHLKVKVSNSNEFVPAKIKSSDVTSAADENEVNHLRADNEDPF